MNPRDLLPPQIEYAEESDPWLLATLDFEETAQFLDLEPWIVNRLRHVERELTVNLALTRDAGEEVTFSGFRVQHHSGNGPTLGPMHLSGEAHLHQVRAAAMEATWQMALLELPFGGATGAVVCDPEQLSERELKAVVRQYSHALRGIAGSSIDVLTPGSGCNEQTMAWMLDRPDGIEPHEIGAVTGKPAVLWGVAESYCATAYGLGSLLRTVVGDLKDCRISLQGFGALGSHVASELEKHGAQLVAVADMSGGLFRADGIDVAALNSHAGHNGVVFGYPEADAVCNADVLEADCDVLVLAAAERQITSANVDKIRARVVVEATSGALTRTAEDLLIQSGKIVVPHVLATLGAAVAAWAEWVRNTQMVFSPVNIREAVEKAIPKALEPVRLKAEECNLSLQRAALVVAAERVAARMRLMGRN